MVPDKIVTTDFAGFADQSYASALQPDGKIILAGHAGSSSTKYSIALVRYRLAVLPLKLLSFTVQKDGNTTCFALLPMTVLERVGKKVFN